MTALHFDGTTLKAGAHKIAELRGTTYVVDGHGAHLGSFKGNSIFDEHGARIATVRRGIVFDRDGKRLGSIRDIRREIDGDVDLALIAVGSWVRRSRCTANQLRSD